MKSNIPFWVKTGIVGGSWGVISLIQLVFNPKGVILYSTLEKIIFFPYWFEMTFIYKTPLGIINYIPFLAGLLIIFLGFLIGAFLGYIYKLVKSK